MATTRRFRLTASALLAASGMALTAHAQQPQGSTVVAGSAHINQQGSYTGITASNGAVINWQSFNIGQGQTVQFFQPDANSRVLNRVSGPDPSRISGNLLSNGIVYITNAAGVFFAHGSLVNVGGIYASAGNISNADFLAGRNHFTGVQGAVQNDGVINSPAAHLIGQRVANYGSINAPNGMVTMTAGSDVFIGEQGGQIFARISGAPAAGGTGVTQAGQINAAGGQVRLGAGDMYAVAIDHPGSTVARNITLQGGRGGSDPNVNGAIVSVTGTLDASDTAAGHTGGTVKVLGDRVGVFGAGYIDASGDAGGGTILVGGNRQGQGPETNSRATYVGVDATLRADATGSGAGGSVVVWSDNLTRAYGHISAHGMDFGGFVETSAKHELQIMRTPDIAATRALGRAGTWLIDPDDLTFAAAGTGNTGIITSGTTVFTSSGAGALLDVGVLEAALTGGATVEVRTGASANPLGGTITLPAGVDIDYNARGNNTLALFAHRRIVLDGRIYDSSNAGADVLNLELTADVDLDGTGNIFIHNTVDTGGGDFTVLRAINFDNTGGTITTHGGDVTITLASSAGRATLGADINAGTGSVLINPDVLLNADITVSGDGVAFARTIESTGSARSLNVMVGDGGLARFFGAIGDVSALSSFSVDSTDHLGTTRLSAGSVTTTGAQSYGQDVVLLRDTTINAGGATFARHIDSDATARDLTVTIAGSGDAKFFGAVGSGAALDTLTVDSTTHQGQTRLAAGAVTTVGAQYYGQDLVLLGNTVLTAGDATFARRIDSDAAAGGRSLTVATTGGGDARFFGRIGENAALHQLTLTGTGTTRLYTRNVDARFVDFGSAVVLGANVDITSDGFIVFRSTVDSTAGDAHSLTLTAPTMNFNGRVGAAGPTTALGTLTTNTGTTTLNAGQLFADTFNFTSAVILANNTTLTATTSARFGAELDSRSSLFNNLTIISPDTRFAGVIGGAAGGSLGTLSTDAAGTTTISAGAVTVANAQFADAVILGANCVLTATSSATFAQTLDSTTGDAHDLTINSPNTTFSGVVGGAANGFLGTLVTDAAGSTFLSANVIANSVSFRDAVVLNGNVTVIASNSADFELTINSAPGQGNSLTINALSTTIHGAVGTASGGILGALTTDAAGATTIDDIINADSVTFNDSLTFNGDSITTTNNQTFAGSLTLGSDVTLTGHDITFGLSIDSGGTGGDRSLTINTTGNGTTRINGPIGTIIPLASLTTNADGTTVLAGGIINTSADQTYNDAVILGLTTVINATNIDFESTIDSDSLPQALTVNSTGSGVTTFKHAIGGTHSLASLITNAAGTTRLGSGVINADGTIAFNDAVILDADTTLNGGGVAFGGRLDSGVAEHSLVVNTSNGGVTSFNGLVGNSSPLASITTNADGTTELSAASVRTNGDQIYHDAVVVKLDCAITAENITFDRTIDSTELLGTPAGLTVNSQNSGTTTFSGAIGGSTPLKFLTTDAAGTTKIGANVTTTTAMTFNDTVRLTGDVTLNLTGGTGTGISFGSTLDSEGSARALTILLDTSSNATAANPTLPTISFSGNVGSAFALSSLTLGGDRAVSPAAATIVAGINAGTPVPSYALSITTTGAFTMGVGQKLSVLGDLTITAGSARVGDISTLGNMTVNSSSIVIQSRPGGNNLFLISNSAGGSALSMGTDNAVDFVAGGNITFSSTPTVSGSFAGPSFATNGAQGISSTLSAFSQRDFGPVSASLFHSGATVLDLAATGPTNVNISEALAGALPDEEQVGMVFRDTAAGKAQQEALAEIGISTNSADAKLMAEILSGRAFYNDAAARDPWSDNYSVTINRLSARAVTEVLATYRAVFMKDGQQQTAHVQQVLAAAWKEYSTAAGDKADALGFRAYCEAVPAQAQATYYLDGLRDLFSQLGYLGLSPAELRHSKATILKAVAVPGLTASQLEAAITATDLGVVVGLR